MDLKRLLVSFVWATVAQCAHGDLAGAQDFEHITPAITITRALSAMDQTVEWDDINAAITQDKELQGIYHRYSEQYKACHEHEQAWKAKNEGGDFGQRFSLSCPSPGIALFEGEWWYCLVVAQQRKDGMLADDGQIFETIVTRNKLLVEITQKFIEKVFVNGEEPKRLAYQSLVGKAQGELNGYLCWLAQDAQKTLQDHAQNVSQSVDWTDIVKGQWQISILLKKGGVRCMVALLQKALADKQADEIFNVCPDDMIMDSFVQEFNSALELVKLKMLLAVADFQKEEVEKYLEGVVDCVRDSSSAAPIQFPSLVNLARQEVVLGAYGFLGQATS